MTGIYKITNKINGKCYIGQSINIKERWKRHRSVSNQIYGEESKRPLYRAIKKYGIENFDFEVIEECSKEQLNDKEIYWISYYDSCNLDKGYNLTKGGDNTGESCKSLTEQQVQEIKQKILDEQSQVSISKEYNVSQAVISYINSGKEYYHEDWNYPIRNRKESRKENKKEKIENLCKDCGEPIGRGAIRCRSCYAKYRITLPPIERDELKKLIREETFSEIGRRFNVVDNTVKKWCKKLNLPYRKKDIELYSDEEWENV